MYHFLMSTVVHLACIVYVVLYTLHKTVCTITYWHVLTFSAGFGLAYLQGGIGQYVGFHTDIARWSAF